MGVKLEKSNDLNLLDLFCGCGGLSLGARRAGLTPVLSIDIDDVLSSSYDVNFGSGTLLNKDLMEYGPEQAAEKLQGRSVDVIVGGPPCQGFSVMGKSDALDPRNKLLARFFEYVAFFRPKFFMMENVPGLGTEGNLHVLRNALRIVPDDYIVLEPLLLNAADFGAATSRSRLIVIGYDPAHVSELSAMELATPTVERRCTVRDAISDLPNPSSNNDWLSYKTDVNLSDYAKMLRQNTAIGPSNVSHGKLESGFLNGFQDTKHTPKVVDRFSLLKQGERDPISKYQKLTWDRPSHVLRAGTGSDRGSFQAARPIHPSEARVITVREAARIQGFPDWFQFHQTKWHSHRMIGNSVSPPFAEAILKRLVAACNTGSNTLAAE